MQVTTELKQSDVDKVLDLVRAETDDSIVSLEDFGPAVVVKTGKRFGSQWIVRKGGGYWRILHRHEWAN